MALTALKEVQEELNLLPTQRDRLEYLVVKGKELESLEDDQKTPGNMVQGCVSRVYIAEIMDSQGKMHFKASSESHLIKGYLTVLFEALNGLTPKQILEETEKPLHQFIEESQISKSLLATRANAFGNIYALIVQKARKHLKDTSSQDSQASGHNESQDNP